MSSSSAFKTGLLIGTAAGGIAAALFLGLLPIAARRAKAKAKAGSGSVDVKDAEQQGVQQRHVIRVTWFDEDFAVCKLAGGPADADVVGWRIVEKSLSAVSAGTGKHPVFAALTSGEYSVVVPKPFVDAICCVPEDGAGKKAWKVDGGWRCFVVDGPMPFELVGIMAKLSSALANAGVSLLAQSTFDTDYVLVKEENVGKATSALRSIGVHVS